MHLPENKRFKQFYRISSKPFSFAYFNSILYSYEYDKKIIEVLHFVPYFDAISYINYNLILNFFYRPSFPLWPITRIEKMRGLSNRLGSFRIN